MFGVAAIFSKTFYQPALKPIMTNFRIEDANKDRVYFDAPLGPVTGIDYTEFTISSKTILSVDTDANFFTVSVAFTHWDINTIKLENSTSNVFDFTMEYIENNIVQPTAPNIKWANATGSGLSDGSSEANAWSYVQMSTSTAAGDFVNVKVGSNVGTLFFNKSGTITAPIVYQGYKVTPGDITSNYLKGALNDTTWDDAEMPTIIGTSRSSDTGWQSQGLNYVIFRNIQVRECRWGIQHRTTFNSNVRYERVNGKDFGNAPTDPTLVSGYFFDGYSVDVQGDNMAFVDCVSINASQSHALTIGNNWLFDGWEAISNHTANKTNVDYGIDLQGDRNVVVRSRFIWNSGLPADIGGGFGVSIKARWPQLTTPTARYNLVADCYFEGLAECINFRWENSEYNVAKRCIMDGGVQDSSGGVAFRDGASFNIFENSEIRYANQDYYGFINYFDAELEDGTGQTLEGNIVRNCLIIGGNVIEESTVPAVNFGLQRNDTDPAWTILDCKIQHCTFVNIPEMFNLNTGVTLTNFEFTNNIVVGVPIRNSINSPVLVETYNNHWNFWGVNGTPETGTGNVSVDPALSASYEPQGVFASLSAPRLTTVLYDKNGDERTDPTTMGAIKHAEEIVIPDVILPELLSAVIQNVSPTNVILTFDEPVTGTNLGFTLAGTTSTSFASLSGSGTDWIGVLATPAVNGETITLSYNSVTGDFVDASDNALADITNFSVTNNVAVSASITMTTTSSNATWALQTVTKTGQVLHWKAEGIGITTQEFDANNPTFNFSANTGNADIFITITSNDGFTGITALDFWAGSASLIKDLNISECTGLTSLNIRYCVLPTLDLTTNTALTSFTARGNGQLSGGITGFSGLSNLTLIWIDVIDNSFKPDLTNHLLVTDFRWYNMWSATTQADIDYINQCFIDLDTGGLSSGNIQVVDTGVVIQEGSYEAYHNLWNKSWTIDLAAPKFDVTRTLTLGVEIDTNESNQQDFCWNNDGNKFFVIGATTDKIFEFATVYPYDIKGATLTTEANVSTLAGSTVPTALLFNKDGTKLLTCDYSSRRFHQYALTIGFDLTTISFVAQSAQVASNLYEMITPDNADFGKVIWACYANTNWYRFDMTTAFDVTTLNITPVQTVTTGILKLSNMNYNLDGKQIFASDENNTRGYYTYDLTTAWDVSTLANQQGPASGPQPTLPGRTGHMEPGQYNQIVLGYGSSTNIELKQYILGDVSPQYNATGQVLERNELGDWSTAFLPAVVEANTDTVGGAYMIHATANTADTGKRIEIDFPMEISSVYTVKIRAKRGSQGTDQGFLAWTGISETINVSISSTTWTEYSFTITATATTGKIRIYAALDTTVIGDDLYVSSLTIKKN